MIAQYSMKSFLTQLNTLRGITCPMARAIALVEFKERQRVGDRRELVRHAILEEQLESQKRRANNRFSRAWVRP